ncbi:MAG: 50S ribosomal protein L19e [archaeon]
MNLNSQKRIAASILKCGRNRVWVDPLKNKEVSEAITREDIRKLVKSGAIVKSPVEASSKRRTRKRALQKKKGRRTGHGSRKGSFEARTGNARKLRWIKIIRPQRRTIKELKMAGSISNETYKILYKLAKGGVFRSKKHLELYIKEHNLLIEKGGENK